jgi:hypothetical protein
MNLTVDMIRSLARKAGAACAKPGIIRTRAEARRFTRADPLNVWGITKHRWQVGDAYYFLIAQPGSYACPREVKKERPDD